MAEVTITLTMNVFGDGMCYWEERASGSNDGGNVEETVMSTEVLPPNGPLKEVKEAVLCSSCERVFSRSNCANS